MNRFWIDHPVTTWMLFAALLICGAYALPRLNIEAMPDTALPSLSVTTVWTGASPSAVQRSLTVPIEAAVRNVHGVENIKARSAPGQSRVEIEFRRDVNLDFARLELGEQLSAVHRQLPPTAGQPIIIPFVPEEFRTEEFFSFSLVSTLPPNELREEAEDWLLPRLLAVPGVADAALQGGSRSVLKVLLDFDLLERYGLTADMVLERLAARDDILPAGVVRGSGRELAVTLQDPLRGDALSRTILAVRGGQPITLGQVASLRADYEDPSYFVRINGQNVVQVTVSKRSGQNAVSVSRRLRAVLPTLTAEMPFPVSCEIDTDEGRELEQKLTELVYRSLIILALLFTLLAAALRRIRLTAIVIASILYAVVISLSLFYFCGISVNFITISGLTVCFGMLLDNSILVLDAIHRRLAGGAADRAGARAALLAGTREVAFPMGATTLTTVVAFLSFIFLSGRLSLYYVPLGVSIGIALVASIFVAFAWVPVALRGPALTAGQDDARRSAQPAVSGRARIVRWVGVALILVALAVACALAVGGTATLGRYWRWGAGCTALLVAAGVFASFAETITAAHLRRWWYPALLVVGTSYAAWWIYGHEVSKGGFWRQQDEERLVVYLERPVGTDVLLSTETMKLFEQELLPLPEGAHMKTWSWENRAFMEVKFEPELKLTAYPELMRNRLIMHAESLGGMFIWLNGFGDPYLKGGQGGGLSNSLIKLTGYNSKRLDEIAAKIMERLGRNRRVRNVRLASGDRFERAAADEAVVLLDRERLTAYRLTVLDVVAHLRRLLGSDIPWHMLIDGEDRRVQMAFADADEIQYEQVLSKVLTTPAGEIVRLGELVRLERRPVLGSINRENQRYSMQVNWEYIGTDKMRKRFITEVLAGLSLPYGYTAEDVSGETLSEEEQEQMRQMLWLTVLFVYMTMAALFESFALPLLILLSIPMALVGVVAIFWAADAIFDSSARIGLVLLFGIVVNNAILLVNRFRLELREAVRTRADAARAVPANPRLGGFDLWRLPEETRLAMLRTAICAGTRIQLRSILLTSGTTIAGLLPLLVRLTEQTAGRDIWENLALSSIGGLISSTLLILGTLPALYWLFTRAGWWLAEAPARLRAWRQGGPEAGPGLGSGDPFYPEGRSAWVSPIA